MFKIRAIKEISTVYFFLLFFFLGVILFYPSLFTFFTHDDFFHLNISNIHSFSEFLGFFNILNSDHGYGFYRPLTNQVPYFLGIHLFNLNPLPLHIFSFIVYFLLTYIVFRLAQQITNNRTIALVTAFLYLTSSIHFVHLYFLQGLQELGVAVFYLLTTCFFIKFITTKQIIYYVLSFVAFILSLTSKEFAVTLPFILASLYFFIKPTKLNFSFKRYIFILLPFYIVMSLYLLARIFFYGFAQGDSYIWDFSFKVFNTLFWYGLWSLNMPEMMVDYIGPGFRINPNLMRFYLKDILPIISLFILQIAVILYMIFKARISFKRDLLFIIFCLSWFFITLLPVLFLPWHKFPMELTTSLFGVVLLLGYLISKQPMKLAVFFLVVYLGLSFLTINLTSKTHWVTGGARVAEKVKNYIDKNYNRLEGKTIVFYDAPEDSDLPWKGYNQLRVILADQNFFEVFYPNIKVKYGEVSSSDPDNLIKIRARTLLY